MRDNIALKIDRDVRNVLVAIQVTGARCDDRFRLGLDQVFHDGKVVGGEVPNDVDIVLKQAKIYPCGVIIKEFPQFIIIDELADFLDRPSEEERVVHHEPEILFTRQFNQLLCLLGC